MENNWKVSVNELIMTFREALISLLPYIKKVKIKWKQGEAYDDWDNIASVLFESIVCNVLNENSTLDHAIQKYDIEYKNYKDLNYIIIRNKELNDKDFVFISFQTEFEPFDRVRVGILNEARNVVDHLNLTLENLNFFYVRNVDNNQNFISELNVPL